MPDFFSNEVLIKTGTLNVLPDANYNSNGFVDGYKQSGNNQVSIKVEDNPPPP